MAATKVERPSMEGKSTMEIEKRIETLTGRMNQLAKDGNYKDADDDNTEIRRLQEIMMKRKESDMGLKLKAELDEIKKAFNLLKDQFNALWNEEMNKFDRDSAKQVVAMKNRQELATNDLSTRLENEREVYPKFSAEVVALRKNEKLLAIEKKFKEALKVKEKADLLQIAEVQKHEKAEDARIKSILNQLSKKHEEEKNGLGRRLDRERKELQIQRDTDFKKIELRFINLQKERDSKYRILVNQEKKSATFEHQAVNNVKMTLTFQDHQAVHFPQALAPLLVKNQNPAPAAATTTVKSNKRSGAPTMSKTNRSTRSGAGAGAGAGSAPNASSNAPATTRDSVAPAAAAEGGEAGTGGGAEAETDPALADSSAFEKMKLVVLVKSARVHEKQDVVLKGDPFVVVKVGQTQKQTKAVKNTLQPVWNEQFTFENVSESDANNVTLSLWDEDTVTKNDLIGTATLQALGFRSEKTPVPLPVLDAEGKEQGVVELEVEVLEV